MVTRERRQEILSLSLDDLSNYYVSLAEIYTNYFLTQNFREDRETANDLINLLQEDRNKCIDEPDRYNSYSLLIDVVECYIHARLLGQTEDAEKFLFIIVCITTSKKTVY